MEIQNMKTVEAIIRLERVGDVRKALAKKGFTSMTLFQVTGRGEQKEARLDLAVGSEVVFDLFARAYIVMAVEDDKVQEVTEIIADSKDRLQGRRPDSREAGRKAGEDKDGRGDAVGAA
ncbi:MAG: P-II family nitrogen regulator [Nitrososphaera sp.]